MIIKNFTLRFKILMKKILAIALLFIFCCLPFKISFSGDSTTCFYLNGIGESFPGAVEIDQFKLDGAYQNSHRLDYRDNKDILYMCELYRRSKEQLHLGPGELIKIENMDNIYKFIATASTSTPYIHFVGFKNERFIMITAQGDENKIENELRESMLKLMNNLLSKI